MVSYVKTKEKNGFPVRFNFLKKIGFAEALARTNLKLRKIK